MTYREAAEAILEATLRYSNPLEIGDPAWGVGGTAIAEERLANCVNTIALILERLQNHELNRK